MAERIKLRKGTSIGILQERLRLPYACVAAMPLPKGEGKGYALLDEEHEEKIRKGMPADLRRMFLANLTLSVPRGEYSVEKVKHIYRLRRTG